MKIKKGIVVFGIVLALVIVAITWNRVSQPQKYSGPVEKIRLGAVISPEASALIYVADQRGFFRDHGLDVSMKDYEAGVIAIRHIADDEIDVATISEFVLVNQLFKGIDVKAICTTVRGTFLDLTGRKDRGIEKGTDWKGKRIGLLRTSNAEFFLESFLTSQGVPMKGVKLIDLKPTEIVDAIIKGEIDGAVSFKPYSDAIKSGLGSNAVSWSVQGRQDSYMLAVGKPSFIKAHPSTIERLLRAMIDAEQYIEKNEAESQKIVAERLKIDQSILPSVWQKSRFNVRLDQDILSLMESEARWIMRNKLTDKTRLLNYFDHMYLDGLEKIKPEAITIIH